MCTPHRGVSHLYPMPNTTHERINRIVHHLSASTRAGAVGTVACPPATMSRPPITSHALNTATGLPAEGLPMKLEFLQVEGGSLRGPWSLLGSTTANVDGRSPGLLAPGTVSVARGRPVVFVRKRSIHKKSILHSLFRTHFCIRANAAKLFSTRSQQTAT